ncbi:hypothetical protein ACFVW2_36290 [Streptomyces sp. NPDC058171]
MSRGPRGFSAGHWFRTIASELRRPASTVSREVGRNSGRDAHRAVTAQERAHQLCKKLRTRRPIRKTSGTASKGNGGHRSPMLTADREPTLCRGRPQRSRTSGRRSGDRFKQQPGCHLRRPQDEVLDHCEVDEPAHQDRRSRADRYLHSHRPRVAEHTDLGIVAWNWPPTRG